MSTSNSVQVRNRELARQINEEARRNPQSPYVGKFVGIANGAVVVVADNWDELAQRLRQVEPDVRNTFCLEVGVDYDAVQEIWGPH
jgi:hypoxanthine-guanine phosphoribosyltransferase